MPPLGTREYEKGPRGKGPLGKLKAELVPSLSQLVVRSWNDQYPDHSEGEGLKMVETPKLYSHKKSGGLMVSAWAKGMVSPEGNIVVAEIVTQDVALQEQGYVQEGPEQALIRVNVDAEKVFTPDGLWTNVNSLTYEGEVNMMRDALLTVDSIGRLP